MALTLKVAVVVLLETRSAPPPPPPELSSSRPFRSGIIHPSAHPTFVVADAPQ